MSSFVLKIIGIITMLTDHYGDSVIKKFTVLNYIGRIAFPIFAFQSVQGFLHTKNLEKHLFKLFVFAIISQAPFTLFMSLYTNKFNLNIFFTLFLGTLCIFLFSKCKNKILGFIIVIICSMISQLLRFDYGAFGILLIFEFYYFEKEFIDKKINIGNIKLSLKKILMTISVSVLCFVKYIPDAFNDPNHAKEYILCGLFTSLSLIFILAYNRKTRTKIKIFLLYILSFTFTYFIFYRKINIKYKIN